MKEGNLKKWYKKSFDSLSGSPSADVWKGIASSLDEIDKNRTALRLSRYYGLSAIVLVGIIGISVFVNQSIDNDTQISNISEAGFVNDHQKLFAYNGNSQTSFMFDPQLFGKQVLTGKRPAKDTSPPSHAASDLQTKINPLVTGDEEFSVHTTGVQHLGAAPLINTDGNDLGIAGDEEQTAKIISMPLRVVGAIPGLSGSPSLPDNLLVQQEIASEYSVVKKNFLPRGFYVGFTYSYNNLWSLNRDTYDGFKSSQTTKNVALFKSSHGIVAGYNISDQSGVQAEIISNSSQGQNHKIYDEDKYIQREIILNYSRINLLYKRKCAKLGIGGLFPVSLNLVAGPYYANLEVVQRTEGDEILTETNEFLDYDLGINLGLEYDVYFSRNLAVSGGLNTSIGLVNIYQGTGNNKTNNLSFGASIGVKYIISD